MNILTRGRDLPSKSTHKHTGNLIHTFYLTAREFFEACSVRTPKQASEGLTAGKKFDDMLNYFDAVCECNRRTDGQIYHVAYIAMKINPKP